MARQIVISEFERAMIAIVDGRAGSSASAWADQGRHRSRWIVSVLLWTRGVVHGC